MRDEYGHMHSPPTPHAFHSPLPARIGPMQHSSYSGAYGGQSGMPVGHGPAPLATATPGPPGSSPPAANQLGAGSAPYGPSPYGPYSAASTAYLPSDMGTHASFAPGMAGPAPSNHLQPPATTSNHQHALILCRCDAHTPSHS